MEGLSYNRRHSFDEDDEPVQEQTDQRLTFNDPDAKSTRNAVDTKDDDSADDRTESRDQDRQVTTDSVAAGFGRAEAPDPKNPEAVREHLGSSWEDFQALQGNDAHKGESIRQFHHAAVHAHGNRLLLDPAGDGPLDYLKNPPSFDNNHPNPALSHASTAYQNLAITETGRLWGHTDPNLERGVEALPQIAERLEAGSNHIQEHTIQNIGLNAPETEGLSWTKSKAENAYTVQRLTDDFTDLDALHTLADSYTAKACQEGQLGHKAASRDDEAGMLYATGNSAHQELLRDRTELRNLTEKLRHEGINGPNSEETLDRMNEIVVHMDYTSSLHGYTQEKLGETLADEQRQSDYEGSLRQRIGQAFESFRNRFGLGGDDVIEPGTGLSANGRPGGPQRLDYPNADPFDESSSLTELTALAFDRVHDAGRDPATEDNLQDLWAMMKSPNGDGDFWQAAAYGSANRDLADPAGHGLKGFMSYHPDPAAAADIEQRSEDAVGTAYRTNIQLLYSEPDGAWQPGERGKNGLLSFNRIHQALYASEEHMRAYGEHAAASGPPDSNQLHWTNNQSENIGILYSETDGHTNPEAMADRAAAMAQATTVPEDHPDKDQLADRSDETGLLYNTTVLTDIQIQDTALDIAVLADRLKNEDITPDEREGAWAAATNTMTQLDYLTGLQEFTNAQLEQRLEAERIAEEDARHRSFMGRIRSLFGAANRETAEVA